MKITAHPNLLILLLIILVCVSCREDELLNEEILSSTPNSPVEEFFLINLNGLIRDQNDMTISGASIIVDGEIFTSNQDGLFSATNIKAPSSGLYIKVLNEGYFVGGTHLIPKSTETVGVEITLLEKEIQNFEATTGFESEINGGARIIIPPAGIQKNGEVYNGTVNIAAVWLNPEEPTTFNIMPGALMAQDEDGDNQFLQSYGMIGVEMTDSAGETLQLREGVTAQLSFPLSNKLLSTAPESIPLWHFDEIKGVWLEEGKAENKNGIYTAEVAHFSWWNCDIPFLFTKLCLDIVNSTGDPINNLTPCLSINGINSFCNPPNQYCGFIPTNQELTLELKSNCNEVIHSEIIGPFSSAENDINELEISVLDSENRILAFNGEIRNCSGTLVEKGVLIAEINGIEHFDLSTPNGKYNINVVQCDESPTNATLTAINLDKVESGTKEINLIQEVTNYEENFSTCGSDLNEIFILNIENLEETTVNVSAYQTHAETLIIASFDDTNSQKTLIGFKGFEVGEFSGNVISNSPGFPSSEIFHQVDRATIIITRYDNIGGYIVGRYSEGDIKGDFIVQRER